LANVDVSCIEIQMLQLIFLILANKLGEGIPKVTRFGLETSTLLGDTLVAALVQVEVRIERVFRR
jgi:hypothetical protein